MIDLSVSFKTGALEYREAGNTVTMCPALQGSRCNDSRGRTDGTLRENMRSIIKDILKGKSAHTPRLHGVLFTTLRMVMDK